MSREVDVTRLRLAHIVAAATALASVLDDLHTLGYERGAQPLEPARSSDGEWSGVDSVGDPNARYLFRHVFDKARDADVKLATLQAVVFNYLNRGGPMPERSKGAFIRKSEFEEAKQYRDKRRENGDYTPVRHVPQPNYPAGDEKRRKR